MSGLLSSKTISNESSVINSGSNIVVNTVTSKGVSTISNVNGFSKLDLDGFFILKNNNGNAHFNLYPNSEFNWYADNGAHRMTLNSSGLYLTGSLTSTSINTNGNTINCGNITSTGTISNGTNTLTTGAITSTGDFSTTGNISSPAKSLVITNVYASGTISCAVLTSTSTIFANGNISNWGTVTTDGLVTNSIASKGTTGPLVIDTNYSTNNHVQINDKLVVNGAIEGTSITANNVNSANYGSQGGNVIITSPFTLYLNTGNNCDTVYNSNRHFFQTQGGGGITCAINWGSTAQNGNSSMTVNGVVYAWGSTLGSDDRIKGEEEFITGATTTLLKLRPQTYNKYNDFSCSGDHIKESGLIAQEVWYDAPELRHIVTHSNDATIDPEEYIPSSTDPTNDPAGYSGWGSNPAGVSYTMLIPYLVKSIQELNQRIYDLEHP